MEKLARFVDKEEMIRVKLIIVSAHVLERISQVANTAHVSRVAMLTPSRSIPIIESCEILQQEAMDETVATPNAP